MRDVLGNEFYGCENSQCHYLIFVTLETHFLNTEKENTQWWNIHCIIQEIIINPGSGGSNRNLFRENETDGKVIWN